MATSFLALRNLGANMHSVEMFSGPVNKTLYFSYETCVACQVGGIIARRDRTFSITTAKHMNKMGVKGWPELGDDAFETLVAS